jgi:hypothetical protein
MSIERDFEKLVIEQNPEQKKASWQKIQKMLEEDEGETVADIEFGNTLAKGFFSNRRNIVIIVSSALVLLTAAILMLVFLLPEPLPTKRYCAMGDYRIEPSTVSIEDYSEQNNLELLYFDWYKDAEYVVETHYKLIDTDEVVCLKEELIDSSGNYILFYITDNNTDIDILTNYNEACINLLEINGIEVKWGYHMNNSLVSFNYHEWNYYVGIQSIVEQSTVENLLKTLIRV